MASRWNLPDAADRRVLSFEELAAELACGTVQWTDRVRNLQTCEVLQASDVLGLPQAASRIAKTAGDDQDRQPPREESLSPPKSDRPACDSVAVGGPRTNPVIPVLVSGVAGLILTGGLVFEQLRRWQRFPVPADSPRMLRPWWFPGIGPVTWIEFWFLCLDMLMVCVLAGTGVEAVIRLKASRSG
jgi:hypothetical protein